MVPMLVNISVAGSYTSASAGQAYSSLPATRTLPLVSRVAVLVSSNQQPESPHPTFGPPVLLNELLTGSYICAMPLVHPDVQPVMSTRPSGSRVAVPTSPGLGSAYGPVSSKLRV